MQISCLPPAGWPLLRTYAILNDVAFIQYYGCKHATVRYGRQLSHESPERLAKAGIQDSAIAHCYETIANVKVDLLPVPFLPHGGHVAQAQAP